MKVFLTEPSSASKFPSLEEFMKSENMIDSLHNNVANQFSQRLEQEVIKRLAVVGITFENRQAFITYVSQNITRITVDGKPNYYELWLGFKSKTDKGVLLLHYRTDVEIHFDTFSGTLTTTIG